MYGADEDSSVALFHAERLQPDALIHGRIHCYRLCRRYSADPRTSSASIRASLMVSVFVFPLPGPASTTQWPVDSRLPLARVFSKLFGCLQVCGIHVLRQKLR